MKHVKRLATLTVLLTAIAVGFVLSSNLSRANLPPGPAVTLWEKQIPQTDLGRIYETVPTPGVPEVIATTLDRVVKASATSDYETLLQLGPDQRTTLARGGEHAGILTHRLHDVIAFEVSDLNGKMINRVETPLHFHYRLAPKGNSFVGVDAGGEHTPPKAERYIYRFYGPLGKVIGEVQSPRPQPNDSAYSSDGASFLISNANGLSAYNPMDASLRWKIGKPVRFFAAADASSDLVVVSDGWQRQIVELYRSGTKQWDFALPGNVRNLGISSNGEFVLASDAKSLHLFRSAGPKPVWSFTVPNPELSINSVAVNNQGIVVLGAQQSGLKGGMVLILDPAGAQLFQKEMVYSLSNAWIPGVQFDATGKLCLIRTVETLTLVSVQ